jgi:hypothetical protein
MCYPTSLSAQWEHTIAVTKDGCEILTLRKGEQLPQLLVDRGVSMGPGGIITGVASGAGAPGAGQGAE